MMQHTSSDAGPDDTQYPTVDPTPSPDPSPSPTPDPTASQALAIAMAAAAKADSLAVTYNALQKEVLNLEQAPSSSVASPWNDFLQRLLSRKFLIALLAQVPVIIAWVTSSIPGQTGAALVAGINLVYIVIEGLVDFKGAAVTAQGKANAMAIEAQYRVHR